MYGRTDHLYLLSATLLSSMDEMASLVLDFKGNYTLHVPSQRDEWRNYRRTEESVLQWHEGFGALQGRIAHSTGIIEALKGDEMSLAPTVSSASTDEHTFHGHVRPADSAPTPGHTSDTAHKAGKHKAAATRQDTSKRRREGSTDSFDAELRRRQAKWSKGGAGRSAGAAVPSTSTSTSKEVDAQDSSSGDTGLSSGDSWLGARGTRTEAESEAAPHVPQSFFSLSPQGLTVDEVWLSTFLSVFLLLLAAAYVTQSPLVAAVAFVLNCMFLLLLYRAKLLNDAVSGCVEALRLAQVRLAGVFASYSSTEMVAQSLCLRKMDIIAAFWEGHMYGVRLPVPILGHIAVDTNLLLSVTIPNLLGLLQLMLTLAQGGETRASSKATAARSVLQQMWKLCGAHEGGSAQHEAGGSGPHGAEPEGPHSEAPVPRAGFGQGGRAAAKQTGSSDAPAAMSQACPAPTASADDNGSRGMGAGGGVGGFTASMSF